MDVMEAIRQRFSCRVFSNREVSQEVIGRLLEAARWAPSAGNLQPVRVVVVRDQRRRRALAEAALGQTFIARAPVVFVVCALPEISARHYGDRGRRLYCIQDAAAATQNLLLAATSAGLGSCWVGAFSEREVSRAVDLPQGWRPLAVVPVGHPGELPATRERVGMETFALWRMEETGAVVHGAPGR